MNAAMFREEWLDKARQLLPNPADRAEFYECMMCKAFGREIQQPTNPIVLAMYTMAEGAIAADIAKYERKCERNRENARQRFATSGTQSLPVAATGTQSLPVAATGTQSQPVAATGTQSQPLDTSISTSTSTSTSPSTSTSTSTSTTSLSNEVGKSNSEEKERFFVYMSLFSRGVMNLQQEVDAFWNYYAALGWKNNKGAPIVSKPAAAAMWRVKNDTAISTPEREIWAKAFKSSTWLNPIIWTSYSSMKVRENDSVRELVITLTMSEEQVKALEEHCEKQLRALMRYYSCTSLSYVCR